MRASVTGCANASTYVDVDHHPNRLIGSGAAVEVFAAALELREIGIGLATTVQMPTAAGSAMLE